MLSAVMGMSSPMNAIMYLMYPSRGCLLPWRLATSQD